MSLIDELRTVDVNRAFLGVDARGQIDQLVSAWADEGLTVRVVRGEKMRSLQGVFDEFAAALQFPQYFGENREAFRECLGDLPNLQIGQGVVLVLLGPGVVLSDARPGDLKWLVDSLGTAATEWGSPIELGEWWDRGPVPFHVVLEVDALQAKLVSRWSSAGADVHVVSD